jgi:hypothetical protein
VFLIGLAGITFETVFMGLERQVTLRQLRYDEIISNIDALNNENDAIAARIADTTLTDRLKQAQENLNSIGIQAEQEHNSISAQISDVEKDLEGQRMLTPENAQLRDRITEKRVNLDRSKAERDLEIKNQMAEFERQRESFANRIGQAVKNNDIVRKQQYENELDQLPNPRPRIEAKYATKIDPVEKDIASLEAEFDQKQKNAPTMSPSERESLEAKRDALRANRDAPDKSWEIRRDTASKQVEEALQLQAKQASFIAEAQKRKDEISGKLSELESQRIHDARTDQVRRIAARFYGTKAENVTSQQAGFISVVWFGSLGMLAALAGPLTAIVALALQSIAETTANERVRGGKLSRLVRRLLLSWRWRRVRSIKVPVEVPVDREIEKRVEVPVERVVKEILYVPILTDDPEAVRRVVRDGLDKELADLVTVSMAGAKGGSPA